jgi:hypothetical protein
MHFKKSFLLLTVLFFIACGGGGGSEKPTPTENPPSTENPDTSNKKEVVLSGTITYDFVPFKSGLYSGLDYDNMHRKKVRGATVEVIDAGGKVVARTTTNSNGTYRVKVTGTQVKVRVLAQLKKAPHRGQASWNFQVKDNTNHDAIYAMEGRLASLGTSGTQTRNLNASSGWDGYSYTGKRVAAPFAILDVIYDAIQMVKEAQSDAVFTPLDIFWSKNNVPASGDKRLGQIVTSHFDGESLYILGAENSDTDEYDRAIIAHEWGHYYEANFSRSDSLGGAHGRGDILDIRLAFGEGFGTAIGCMVNKDPLYIDSYGAGQHQSFGADVEAKTPSSDNPGWYSEASVYRILYDIYDDHDDGADTLSLGFAPMHKVLIDAQKNTNAFTSIFPFITALKDQNPEYEEEIDAITSSEKIAPIHDIYGTGRTNRKENANPLYAELPLGGSVDIKRDYSAKATDPKGALGAYNFVKFTIPSEGEYTFTIREVGGSGRVDPNLDPDFFIYKGASNQPIAQAVAERTTDSLTTTLSAGTYRMSVIVYGQSSSNIFRITLN